MKNLFAREVGELLRRISVARRGRHRRNPANHRTILRTDEQFIELETI